MIKFTFIDEAVPGININLNVLLRGTERYHMLLYQHEGILAFTEHETKLGNLNASNEKFRSFFALARENNVDLAMTPEYSCPWSNISEIIDHSDLWPAPQKLWALGAESITREQFKSFVAACNLNNVIVHFDKSRLQENGTFFDPLVYIFRGQLNGDDKLFVIVQFKTHHMGVWSGGDKERDRLILGREIYVLRNDGGSTNLLTVICSEAMNFHQFMTEEKRNTLGWNDRPFLILHPQVNPDPIHTDFIAFRKFVFEQERKEIISLNWNLRSKTGPNNLLRHGASRSGVYMVSSQIKHEDEIRIRSNHNRGLYYFCLGQNKHAFILNSKPHAYLLANLPVHITQGVGPQQMRNGPELIATFEYTQDGMLTTVDTVSDDHLNCLVELGCTNAFLVDPSNCILEKERLVCLSSGAFLPKSCKDWPGVDKMFSFRLMENTEYNKRITFTEDNNDESLNQRANYIEAINTLDGTILPNKDYYPDSIAGLKDFPIRLAYSQDTDGHGKNIKREGFRYNLVDANGKMLTATVCYLGLKTAKEVDAAFDFLQGMFDTGNMNRRRVIIFYKKGTDYFSKADNQAGNFFIPDENRPASFLND